MLIFWGKKIKLMALTRKSEKEAGCIPNGIFRPNSVNIYIMTDDKSKREGMASSYEAKQVDDKFKEIMQKRKGKCLTLYHTFQTFNPFSNDKF